MFYPFKNGVCGLLNQINGAENNVSNMCSITVYMPSFYSAFFFISCWFAYFILLFLHFLVEFN